MGILEATPIQIDVQVKQQQNDNKLPVKYYGPCKMLQRIKSTDYRREFPPSSCVHPSFHVSLVKRVIGESILFHTILIEINEYGKLILETEIILDTRIKKLHN